jgi:signal transduction histidine kinase
MRFLDRWTSIKAKIALVIIAAIASTIVVMYGLAVGLAVYLSDKGVGRAIADTASFVRSIWWETLLAGAVAAAVALMLVRSLAKGLTAPLRDMSEATRRMTKGDYTVRVEAADRSDEVGRLADAFNRMAGELESVERLRRDLIANVSHELRTPISAIRAHLENLAEGVEEANPETLAVMLQQTERLGKLVEGLLDLSRLESGATPMEIEAVGLLPLARQAAAEVQIARRGKHVEVVVDVPDGLVVAADPARIGQVLFNLLDNALRFTPEGGRVGIRAAGRDGICELVVEDTGPGIPSDRLGIVFERFYRVDPARSRSDGGAGLGLAIARTIVEAHGGRIWAETAPGGGCEIHLSLPSSGTGNGTRRTALRATAKGER